MIADAWSAAGRRNSFGTVPEVIKMRREAEWENNFNEIFSG